MGVGCLYWKSSKKYVFIINLIIIKKFITKNLNFNFIQIPIPPENANSDSIFTRKCNFWFDFHLISQALTFARVFTNNESADAYQNIFAAVFSVVKEDTNNEICFFHINGKGIKCILADAHQGQALGIYIIYCYFFNYYKILNQQKFF